MTARAGEHRRGSERPGRGLGWVCLCAFSSGGALSPATLAELSLVDGGRDGGVALSVSIGILRDQFTRCVVLTFTVTVITSRGFPTPPHCTGCAFNYSKHTDSTG